MWMRCRPRTADRAIPVRDMPFNGMESMMIAGKDLKILTNGQPPFANRATVAYAYLKRCPMGLQAEKLNYCP